MIRRHWRGMLAVLIAAISVRIAVAEVPLEEHIAIDAGTTSYVLTVPVSRLAMTIPKAGLVLKSNETGGAANNPRYFYFVDDAHGLIVSGWFEPAQSFTGIDKFWKSETDNWKQRGFPPAHNVSFSTTGNWQTIVYDMVLPRGTNSHIRAHWIQAGTWIDIHLSLTSDHTNAENRQILESLLRSLSVKEKEL